jgi:hypothetical protein
MKIKLSELKQLIKEQLQNLNEEWLSDLKTNEKFKLTGSAKVVVNGFLKKIDPSDVVFTVIKNTGKSIFVTGNVDNKYKDEKGRINFKINSTGHWRSQGTDATVKKIGDNEKIDNNNELEKELKSISNKVLSECSNLLKEASEKMNEQITKSPQNVRLATIRLFINQFEKEALDLQRKINNF